MQTWPLARGILIKKAPLSLLPHALRPQVWPLARGILIKKAPLSLLLHALRPPRSLSCWKQTRCCRCLLIYLLCCAHLRPPLLPLHALTATMLFTKPTNAPANQGIRYLNRFCIRKMRNKPRWSTYSTIASFTKEFDSLGTKRFISRLVVHDFGMCQRKKDA